MNTSPTRQQGFPCRRWRARHRARTDLATAALRPSHHLTGKTACRRDPRRRARFAQVQPVRFDRPSGGTAEFLGRDTRVSQPPGRKARRPDPPYVFGAVSPAATTRNEPRGVSAAKSLRDSLNAFATAQEKRKKRARSRCALLTGGAIYVCTASDDSLDGILERSTSAVRT